MSNRDLVIINNERVSKNNESFYCDNVDMKSIPEGLDENFKITLIARKSKTERKRKINLIEIKISSNIFVFLYNILKTFKNAQTNYLIISITPYTFFSYLLLFFFRKKVFVYLRSNGYEEYRAILGFIGPAIYHVMFKIVTFKSNIIVCQEQLFKKRKCEIVFPSEINSLWLENLQEPVLDKPRLLYVGRIKVEKGIFSLLKIFDEINEDFNLSIVGSDNDKNQIRNKIKYIGHGYDANELVKIYDKHNISILPSFTEAHPKVIDESLSRKRPVIIFKEIEHIIQNRKGIFVANRNANSLMETISFIMKNYKNIQASMEENKLPTKKEFISKMSNILNSN